MINGLRSSHRRFISGLLLMLPASVLILIIYSVSLAFFMRYSFYDYQSGQLIETFHFGTYVNFFSDRFYWNTLYTSFKLSMHVTLLTFILGYPIAYTINRVKNESAKKWLMLAVFSPLLVSVVVRAYGWLTLLGENGLINFVLHVIGAISDPVRLVHNYTGVLLATTHVLLPFMIFPILSVLKQFDPALKESALDLGANRLQIFVKVTLPLTIQGAVAGMQIVFPLVLSAFVTPALLGGGRVMVMPTLIYRTMLDVNWPVAAVAGLTLLVLTVIVTFLLNRLIKYFFLGRVGG